MLGGGRLLVGSITWFACSLLREAEQRCVCLKGKFRFWAGLCPAADLWAQGGTLEAPAHSSINAARLAPSWVHALETVSLEARELLGALLDNLPLVRGSSHASLQQNAQCCKQLHASWQIQKTAYIETVFI